MFRESALETGLRRAAPIAQERAAAIVDWSGSLEGGTENGAR
jgi:hypothetical protein